MLTVLSIFVIYLVGVLVALIIIAWGNTHSFGTGAYETPPEMAILSWITVFIAMIMLITYPFVFFYDWCYNKFEKSLK